MNENQTRILIIIASVVALLLLVLVVVLLSGDGDTAAADTSTTTAATTTSEVATTTEEPTTTEAATTTSEATTTTAATTTTTSTTTTTLPPDFALAFDGTDDFVSVFDNGDFDFNTGMVVEAWVKPTVLDVGGSYAAVLRGAFNEPPGGGGGWVLSLNNADHSDFGLSACVPSCNVAKSGPGGLAVGSWQHVAGMYDGTTIQIYRNGQFVTSTPLSGDLSDINYLLIGVWVDSFHGLIDEVRVWNTARSPAQIQDDYDRVLDGTEVGLVGYWRFNEGSGQVAGDLSGQGNDGKLGAVVGVDVNDPIWTPSDVPVG